MTQIYMTRNKYIKTPENVDTSSFWDVITWSMVHSGRRFRGTCILQYLPWWWKHHFPTKVSRFTYTRLHGDTSRKRALFILSVAITLNPKHKVFSDTTLVMILQTYLETEGMVLEWNAEAAYC